MGMTASWNSGSDFRGALGVQVGTTALQDEKSLLDLSLTGKVWDRFIQTNNVVLGGTGAGLTMTDPQAQVFGEFVGTAAYYSKESPWSGFLNIGTKFNGEFWSLGGTAGARYKF